MHLTPFAVAWTLAAIYCAVVLAAAGRIGMRVVRNRGTGRDQTD
jgi:hypothetical protein